MNKGMNYRWIAVVAIGALCSGAAAAAEKNMAAVGQKQLSLGECYVLALKQSEALAIQKDLIGESEARFVQALGGMLPHVAATMTDTLKDKSGVTSAYSSVLNAARTYERSIVVKQTLFSGFKEFAGMAGSRFEKSQRANELKRAKQLLWVDVASAFYLLLQQREDLKELENTRLAFVDRIKELEDRVRVGRSRKSEIVNTQVQMYALQAQIETGKSREQVAGSLLEFLTGTKVDAIVDGQAALQVLRSEEEYVAQSQGRFDVLALADAFNVSQQQIRVVRSDLWPSVSLEGDYFLKRNTAPRDSHWSALLSVDVPIFQGTRTYGQIAQARLQAHEKELALARGRRTSRYDVHDVYTRAAAEMRRCDVLKLAMDAANENYNLQRDDYQFNLVSNLDVLAAIQSRNDARRAYAQSFYDAKRLYEELRVAAGEIPIE